MPSSPDSSPRVRRLLIVRHAKAEPFAAEDHRRELTPRGCRDAADAGSWLITHGHIPTHVYVSSATRAQQTWKCMRDVLGESSQVTVAEELYSAGPDEVIELLRQAPADAAVVAYVGHNPTAASLAHLLDSGEPDVAAFRELSAGFPTAAVAVLEVTTPWAELQVATARLADFHVGNG